MAKNNSDFSKTQNSAKTKYINDVALRLVQVLLETDNAGIIGAGYTYGQGLISMYKNGEDSYYHYDGLGSVKQLTDEDGAVIADYTYDSFGNLIASSGTTSNAYGFTGEQQFGEADNLVFLRTRYYTPSVGRFIKKDPIGYIAGTNLYSYVRNNPVNKADPSGMIGWGPYPGTGPIIDIDFDNPPPPSCREIAQEIYDKNGGNPDDFMRHCVTSCEITKKAGALCAWAAGWWNELRPGRSGQSGMWEDTHNNAIGRGCANDVNPCGDGEKPKSCEECCSNSRGK